MNPRPPPLRLRLRAVRLSMRSEPQVRQQPSQPESPWTRFFRPGREDNSENSFITNPWRPPALGVPAGGGAAARSLAGRRPAPRPGASVRFAANGEAEATPSDSTLLAPNHPNNARPTASRLKATAYPGRIGRELLSALYSALPSVPVRPVNPRSASTPHPSSDRPAASGRSEQSSQPLLRAFSRAKACTSTLRAPSLHSSPELPPHAQSGSRRTHH